MRTQLIVLFFSYLLIAGCTSVPQELDPEIFYKRDMGIEVNGKRGEGVLVVPRASRYKFDIRAKGKLDLFTFTTCHREQTKEKAGERGWFSDKKHRELTFLPAALEKERFSCPVQLGGYEAIKGRHSWGLVEFEHPSLTLPAVVSCNGVVRQARGVSVCQSKAGLLMEIVFRKKVLYPKENTCVKLTSKDGLKFRFALPKKQCSFRFVTERGELEMHRLTTVGYEKILIREN